MSHEDSETNGASHGPSITTRVAVLEERSKNADDKLEALHDDMNELSDDLKACNQKIDNLSNGVEKLNTTMEVVVPEMTDSIKDLNRFREAQAARSATQIEKSAEARTKIKIIWTVAVGVSMAIVGAIVTSLIGGM